MVRPFRLARAARRLFTLSSIFLTRICAIGSRELRDPSLLLNQPLKSAQQKRLDSTAWASDWL
jgi:hypothetical protein